jgi:uncharacterized protein
LYELLEPIEDERGLAALPLPSLGDIFLDFEAAPYAFEPGLECLIGVALMPEQSGGKPNYDCTWSSDPKAEKQGFERFITTAMDRWELYPDFHIYHYAHYEQTTIKHLAARHGTCVDEVDQLLRAGIFVDLYRVVSQALRASIESYSIKQLEPSYNFVQSVRPRDSVTALQTFEAG